MFENQQNQGESKDIEAKRKALAEAGHQEDLRILNKRVGPVRPSWEGGGFKSPKPKPNLDEEIDRAIANLKEEAPEKIFSEKEDDKLLSNLGKSPSSEEASR